MRQIPYNYTSANDDQIIKHLFGSELAATIHSLGLKTRTGRSARLLFRFMGDMFIIQHNPFLFQELVEHPLLRKRLFAEFENDLAAIKKNADQKDVILVLEALEKALYGEYKQSGSSLMLLLTKAIVNGAPVKIHLEISI